MSKTLQNGPPKAKSNQSGFSLVMSLVVMAMLMLLCVSIASMLALQLRLGGATLAMTRARLNAVSAGRIALGELQRLAGSDRRITANAAIIAPAGDSKQSPGVGRPRAVGVWKGLTATPGNPAGWSKTNLPAVAPVTPGASGAYSSDHDNAFAGWLSSGTLPSGSGEIALTDSGAKSGSPVGLNWMRSAASTPNASRDRLLLTGGGKNGYDKSAAALMNQDEGDLFATPESFLGDVNDLSAGNFAWTVMDENQKARVDIRDDASAYPAGERATFASGAAGRFHPGYAADGTGDWRSSLPKAAVPVGRWTSLPFDIHDAGWFPTETGAPTVPARALRHDFTTASVSLLTDVANGGLKRDVNLLALMSDPGFDAATGVGGVTGYVGFETNSSGTPSGRSAWWRSAKTSSIPYPDVTDKYGAHGKVWPIWSDVREWSRFSTTALADGKPMMTLSGGVPAITQVSAAGDRNYLVPLPLGTAVPPDRKWQASWRQPVVYRYRHEISLYAVRDAAPAVTYAVLPKINIVVQLWNPTNVAMRLDGASQFGAWLASAPYQFVLSGRDSADKPLTKVMDFAYIQGSRTGITTSMLLTGTLAPGEIRTWSIPASVDAVPNGSVTLTPGYFPSGGAKFGSAVISDTTGFKGDSPVNVSIRLRTTVTNFKEQLFLMAGASPILGAAHDKGFPANRGSAVPHQNPARLVGNGATISPNPISLVNQPSSPIAIFEIRQKAEAFSGVSRNYVTAANTNYDDARRFSFGEPVGLWRRVFLQNGKIESWYAAPSEAVVWSTNLNDSESDNSLSVDGSGGELGYGGTGHSASTGLTSFVHFHLPYHPPVGLFSLRHARLGGGTRPAITDDRNDTDPGLFCVREAFGNSLLNPYVATDAASGAKVMLPGKWVYNDKPAYDFEFLPCDMSWIMNASVADSWFTSSLGEWDKGVAAQLFPGAAKNVATLWAEFLSAKKRLPNRRLVADTMTPSDSSLFSGSVASQDAFRKLAAHALCEGGFNINSTSVRAWRAFLASAHADTAGVSASDATGVLKNTGGSLTVSAKAPGTSVVPVSDTVNHDLTDKPGSDNAARVNGGRVLSDDELDKLAVAMVERVKKRGPFLNVGEFLNRRLEPGENGYMGVVQSAIESAGLNNFLATTGRTMVSPGAFTNADLAKVYKYSGVNRPGWLSQGDLLAPVANAMSARGDTFVIRVSATAEAGGPRATVELTVRRSYAYLNSSEPSDTEYLALNKTANRAFGRRFIITDARWLSDEEV